MSLLIDILESMEPQSLFDALKALDSDLEIARNPSEVDDPEKVEFAVVWKHETGSLKKYPQLKAVSTYGHGVDGLLSDSQLPDGVPLVRLSDQTMAVWMSEYLLAVVLLQRRHLLQIAKNPDYIGWGISARNPGNQIGILGLGYLGKHSAQTFLKMGFDVCGWSRTSKKVDGIECLNGEEGLDSLLAKSDYLINLLPLTPATENLLNAKTLSKTKKGSYLINVGRGHSLVEEDLIPLLDQEHLSGACLDVFRIEPLPMDHPFRNHSKILITPHHSSATPAESVAPQILENYQRAISGQPLLNKVDLKHGY